MKKINRHLSSIGDFYMRHRKLLVGIKVFLVIIIGTMMFTVWSDNGHTTRHGTAQTFADSLCGNGKCDNNNEYCGLSTTDCSQINTGSCSNITGCILKNTTIESCTGTTFSCSSIGDKTTCNDIGCYWDATNTCAKPAANKETCESLNTTQCNVAIQNNISDCTSASYTIENCKGTITTPENESDCTTLNNISFALTTKRYPEYIEDTTSCPADCSMPSDPRCGNGTCDSSAAKCSMSTTDCSKLDTSTCPGIAGCELKDGPTMYSCDGTFDTCTSLDATKCATNTACTLGTDNKCTSDVSKRKSCKDLGEAVCKSYGTCNRKGTVSRTCGGTVQTPKNDVDCNILATQLQNFGFSITRYPEYIEDTTSCPADCSTSVCGDGVKEGTEFCDEGANNGFPGHCRNTCDSIETKRPLCQGASVSTLGKNYCSELSLSIGDLCGNYFSIMNMQCDLNPKDGKCYDWTECSTATSCSNSIVEGDETCDNGNLNSDTVKGACKTTCDGYVAAVPTQTCGNGVKEGSETCDNGDSNGKAGMCNADCNGYIAADNTCGNGKCESSSACTLSTTACNKIDNMTTCPTVAGCSVKESTTTSCEGEFSCMTITNSDTCNKSKCNRSPTDKKCIDVYKDGKKISGFCSNFSSDVCKTLSNCSQKTTTTSHCDGSIAAPGDKKDCMSLNSIGANFGITTSRKTMYQETSTSCPADCAVTAKCGDSKVEGTETCDDGSKNSDTIPGACNTKCTGYLPMTSCGNFIIEAGEVCDNGTLLNGKPGQCNLSCDGWISYNGYCGDGVCGAYCKISSSASTCTNFNTSEATKALCPTLGCMLQYTDTSTCKGTVSCKDITAEKFWNSKEAAHKYCDIAGCTRDNQTNACGLLATQKAPSCSDLGKKIGLTTNTAEYCPRITGCILYTGNIETKCIGTTPPRADKLDQNQCATIKGTWTSESISSCNTDCKPSCTPTSTTITHADGSLSNRKCNELSLSECTQYYNPEGSNNCILRKSDDGKEYCIEDSYTCTTCGNGICDVGETESSCSQDCLTEQDWPKVLYSSYPTDDGKLIKGPVQASVYLPPNKGCKIINNNNEGSYNFRYNGYYVFQVMCPWFDKPWDLMAKVYWLNSDTITAVNAKDMISSSGGSVIYYENKDKFIDTISTESSMVAAAKKAIYEQTLITTLPNAATQSDLTQVITTNKNISFENDSNVYQKISLEKTMGDTTKSTQKVQLTIPDTVTLYTNESGKKTEFSGVFIAPTAVTGKVLTIASQEIQNLDTVIKAGTDKELIAVTGDDSTVSFTITIWTEDALGKMLDIYMSQDGIDREYYTGALVEPCVDSTDIKSGVNCASFEVPHLTYYGITTNITDTEDNDTGEDTGKGDDGGGKTPTIPATDLCVANRNCNDISLIALCGACSGTIVTIPATGTTIAITPENEQFIAYQYAFLHNITTMPYERARLGDSVTRGELAKMIVNFAKNVLSKTGDTKKVCAFSDNINGSKEDKSFIIQACQMGLMGLKADGKTPNALFNPQGVVSRAEFGTVFSRLMYGAIYNPTTHSSAPYYENHLKALQREGIMKKIDQPENKEQRGFVMIMMMRADLQDKALNMTQQTEASNTIVKFFKNLFQ